MSIAEILCCVIGLILVTTGVIIVFFEDDASPETELLLGKLSCLCIGLGLGLMVGAAFA